MTSVQYALRPRGTSSSAKCIVCYQTEKLIKAPAGAPHRVLTEPLGTFQCQCKSNARPKAHALCWVKKKQWPRDLAARARIYNRAKRATSTAVDEYLDSDSESDSDSDSGVSSASESTEIDDVVPEDEDDAVLREGLIALCPKCGSGVRTLNYDGGYQLDLTQHKRVERQKFIARIWKIVVEIYSVQRFGEDTEYTSESSSSNSGSETESLEEPLEGENKYEREVSSDSDDGSLDSKDGEYVAKEEEEEDEEDDDISAYASSEPGTASEYEEDVLFTYGSDSSDVESTEHAEELAYHRRPVTDEAEDDVKDYNGKDAAYESDSSSASSSSSAAVSIDEDELMAALAELDARREKKL